jgi:hypothetical protein
MKAPMKTFRKHWHMHCYSFNTRRQENVQAVEILVLLLKFLHRIQRASSRDYAIF